MSVDRVHNFFDLGVYIDFKVNFTIQLDYIYNMLNYEQTWFDS